MENSILNTIRTMIGGFISETTDFNTDVIVCINSALAVLTQAGVGPKGGFRITGDSEVWSDFIGDAADLENVKTYVYLKTKLMFDPPGNSFLVSSIENELKEHIWRLNVAVDTNYEEEE